MTTTYLYRLLDQDSRLLYIGITSSPIHRLFQHLEEKPWAPQITWQHVKRYEDREEALRAEELAIRSERPLYNIQHNQDRWPYPVINPNASNIAEQLKSRNEVLFQIFAENAVPKDPNLSVANARAVARLLCGSVYNFNKADWLEWCQLPDEMDAK